jgi:hypothetical protein
LLRPFIGSGHLAVIQKQEFNYNFRHLAAYER